MAVVSLVLHTGRPEAITLARRAAEWLNERGHRVMLPKDDAAAAELDDAEVRAPDQNLAGADLAVSLGGDGTMLRTVAMAAPVLLWIWGRRNRLAHTVGPMLRKPISDRLAGRNLVGRSAARGLLRHSHRLRQSRTLLQQGHADLRRI